MLDSTHQSRRRKALWLLLTSPILAIVASGTLAKAALAQVARDAAPEAGIGELTRSWSLAVDDFDGDGHADFLLSRHGGAPAHIWDNHGGSFAEFAAGELPAGADRHGCDWSDVNLDGLYDVFCAVGAEKGTAARKSDQLYIQGPSGQFTDMTRAYGLVNPWGRGRHVTFLDVNHDPYPDLFIGNGYPRADEHTSPNRVFLNDGGSQFVQMSTRVRAEIGARCVQAVDMDGDGWEDLLVCGQEELKIYRNRRGENFSSIESRLGAMAWATNARLADLNGDEQLDLVAVTPDALWVQLRSESGFEPAVRVADLVSGAWLTVGDADGNGHLDVYVVQACQRGVNQADALYLNDGSGVLTSTPIPQTDQGCGDVAATIDYDEDGMDDFIVTNGKGQAHKLPAIGPLQLITLGSHSAG
jgi:hypothetical protein